jgi:WD40 repeat protein
MLSIGPLHVLSPSKSRPLQHQGIVFTASSDNHARIWDVRTDEPIGTPPQHQDKVNTAAFDPKGERVVTASEDKTARIWDVSDMRR